MADTMERIMFTAEDGSEVAFYVLEQTRIGGVNYILVADSEEEEAEALILRESSQEEGEEAVYEIVEDDQELNAISKVFVEMMDDVDIKLDRE